MSQKLKIIIADDHPLTLKGFVSLFDAHPEIDVINQARNGVELLELLSTYIPDVVVLDIEMPQMNGLDAMKKILDSFPKIKIILMSFYSELSFISHCISLGANAYITKGSELDLITESIRKVHEDGYFFDKTVLDALAKTAKGPQKQKNDKCLSDREAEVLKLICLGYMNKEIAAELHIFIGTVDFHKKNISKKTGCKTKASLVLYAIENNFILAGKGNSMGSISL